MIAESHGPTNLGRAGHGPLDARMHDVMDTATSTSLRIGPLAVDPPVVLAPMAGVTNSPFRTLCRRYGPGIYVCEMVMARAIVEGSRRTMRMIDFAPDESPRSIQLYGTEPTSLGEAVRILVGQGRVDHVDMNFGCPAPKVTKNGGGAAVPLKRNLFRSIVRAAVRAANEESGGRVPVTLKFRKGLKIGRASCRERV